MLKLRLLGLLLFMIVSGLSRAQTTSQSIISVEGEVSTPLKLTETELLKFKQLEISAKDHDGQTRVYKGVSLSEILTAAGVTMGSQLRGKNLSKYVVVKAADNYQVVFSLPEIDPEFSSEIILLAYQVEGKALEKGDGPFRMVVPKDKKHARWIREVTSIKVVSYKE